MSLEMAPWSFPPKSRLQPNRKHLVQLSDEYDGETVPDTLEELETVETNGKEIVKILTEFFSKNSKM